MPITMTEVAIDRFAKLKKRRQTPDSFLKVGVRGGGCSGLEYFVDIVENIAEGDRVFVFRESHKLAIDKKSYLFLNGTEIDFLDTLMKTGFIFNNPHASRSCSCGDSFTL